MHERTAASTYDAKPAILPPELTQETDAVPPLYLDTSALDFSAITDTYTKIADPTAAVRPEFATERQALTTSFARADGQQYVETENIAEVGDAIITGPEGERYSIPAADFAALYEPLRGEDGAVVPGAYLPKNQIKAMPNPTGREIVIDAPWGGQQHGEADCWLVESQVNGDRYIIEAAAFAQTYRLSES